MSAVSMLQNEGSNVTRTASHEAFSMLVSFFWIICCQLNVMKTMCVRVRTKTIVERLAVKGSNGNAKHVCQNQG